MIRDLSNESSNLYTSHNERNSISNEVHSKSFNDSLATLPTIKNIFCSFIRTFCSYRVTFLGHFVLNLADFCGDNDVFK